MLRIHYSDVLGGAAAALLILASPALAEDGKTPYWASIRPEEVNMRVGPGEEYRILWVYHRPQLPMKVLRIKEGWRLVEDPFGFRGWVLARFLTRERTGVINGKVPVEMRARPDSGAHLDWRLGVGVIGKLGECAQNWCKFSIGARQG